MADFEPAYKKEKRWEGGFVDHPNDKGLMTYAGITQKYNSDWPGWNFIWGKLDYGRIKHNTIFPELEPLVKQFYEDLWNKNNYSQIKDQNVANLLFDFGVNSGQKTAIKEIQKLVGVSSDGVMGKNTITAINASNAKSLFDKLWKRREEFYNAIIARDPSQKVFEKGWKARLNDFRFEGGISIFIILVFIGIFYLIFNQ